LNSVIVAANTKTVASVNAPEPKRLNSVKQRNNPKNSTTKRTTNTSNKPTNKLATPAMIAPSLDTNKDTTIQNAATITKNSKQTKLAPRKRPPQGTTNTKASIVCGCYGLLHKACTNCLQCGRISCEKEGYEIYCPFCEYWMDVPNLTKEEGNPTTTSSSWLAKERLLQLDQTQASQMEVYDDQEDYYSTATSSAWLTQEELVNVQRRVEDRQESLRPSNRKQVLELQF
jgi:uncharacterized Zn finger protein (UPF0148 family)